MKLVDFLLILIIVVICGLVIFRMIKQRKAGKSCSCGCSGCSGNNSSCKESSVDKKETK